MLKNKLINFEGLIAGVDYEVVSMEVYDESKDKYYPFERKFNVSLNEALKGLNETVSSKANFLRENFEKGQIMVFESPAPSFMGVKFNAIEINEKDVDYNYIVDCGLGLMKMTRNGKLYLYNAHNNDEYFELMFEIYMSIVDKNYFNRKLETIANSEEGEDVMKKIQVTSDFSLYSQLLASYNMKKGGDNVIHIEFGGELH